MTWCQPPQSRLALPAYCPRSSPHQSNGWRLPHGCNPHWNFRPLRWKFLPPQIIIVPSLPSRGVTQPQSWCQDGHAVVGCGQECHPFPFPLIFKVIDPWLYSIVYLFWEEQRAELGCLDICCTCCCYFYNHCCLVRSSSCCPVLLGISFALRRRCSFSVDLT